jgi:hypothetical protein
MGRYASLLERQEMGALRHCCMQQMDRTRLLCYQGSRLSTSRLGTALEVQTITTALPDMVSISN